MNWLKRWAKESPGSLIVASFEAVTFLALCLYWIFGPQDWTRLLAFVIWMALIPAAMNIGQIIDGI